jgi:hypothetical protein
MLKRVGIKSQQLGEHELHIFAMTLTTDLKVICKKSNCGAFIIQRTEGLPQDELGRDRLNDTDALLLLTTDPPGLHRHSLNPSGAREEAVLSLPAFSG